jgi:hypothetical protein
VGFCLQKTDLGTNTSIQLTKQWIARNDFSELQHRAVLQSFGGMYLSPFLGSSLMMKTCFYDSLVPIYNITQCRNTYDQNKNSHNFKTSKFTGLNSKCLHVAECFLQSEHCRILVQLIILTSSAIFISL